MNKFLMSMLVVFGVGSALTASAQTLGDAEAGKEKSAVCAACHGPDGNSAAPNFPKLAGQGAKYLVKQMQDVKSGARPVLEMTGILDGLNEKDFQDIAAYYASQSIVVSQANPELVELGEKIYRAGNPATKVAACMACHGPAGAGMDLAAFPALAGQHADYTAKQLKMFRTGERANDGDARIMRSVAARLSDREIEAVASYISGLYQ